MPVLAALAGALVAGLITALLVVLQGVRERRRALRTLLYQLLELRYQIRTREPRELFPFIIKYLTSRAGPEATQKFNTPDVQHQLREVMRIATSIVSARPFAPAYQQAVEMLAPYDPILAYRLTGQEGLLGLDRELKFYYEKVVALPNINLDETQRSFVEQAQSTTLSTAYRIALDELAKKISSVGIKLSPITWYRANHVIKRQDDLMSDELEKKMTQVLDNWITELAKKFSTT